MAAIYVRSTDGSDADNGSTWALAKATVAGAIAIASAGDIIYVSQAHAESSGSNITWSSPGTAASPVTIVCANDAAEPPTALATSATVTVAASAGSMSVTGTTYVYGISFTAGNAAGNPVITLGSNNHWQRYESCNFILASTGAAGVIRPVTSGQALVRTSWLDCHVKFAAASQGIQLNGDLEWHGGSVLSGGTSPTSLIASINVGASGSSGVRGMLRGLDLSNCSASVNLVTNSNGGGVDITFQDCRLPASWSGGPLNGSLAGPAKVTLVNCDTGATNHKRWEKGYSGDVTIQTATLIKTGGSTDGVTPFSFKLVSSATVGYPVGALYSPWMRVYVGSTGASKTVSVSILRDSATNLKDNEVWGEVAALGNSSYPLASFASDRTANVLTAAADQSSDGGATWDTTGMGNPNKQKVDMTITPQMKGYFWVRVVLAKASTTIYVDGKPSVT